LVVRRLAGADRIGGVRDNEGPIDPAAAPGRLLVR
jgi:hypothetical protein